MDSLCPFDHLHISQVKCSSFLYLCQSWKKWGEIVEIYGFFLKILYIRGRNTCLCKGEMYFILLGECLPHSSCTPVLWPCLHTLCLSFIYLWWCMSSSPTFTMLFLFYLYTHVSYSCMQSIISISHKNALMSFV